MAERSLDLGALQSLLERVRDLKVVCVGDQLFRDIRGANRAGLDSILVDFIRLPGETHYGKKRVLEKAILWFYHRDPRRRGRLDGIGK